MSCPSRLTFRLTPGTTSCGGPGLSPAGVAPFSGGLFDATGGGTKVADLGLGCLYFGGGVATNVAPGAVPDGAAFVFDTTCDDVNPDQLTLTGSPGTGLTDCTLGPLATKHCANESAVACTSDADCTMPGAVHPCQLDARCLFGPPLPLPNVTVPVLSACVVNVFASNAGGTADAATGTLNLTSFNLTSRVYLTGNLEFPCPVCVSGLCNGGQRQGLECTPVGSQGTTTDCPPADVSYLGDLAVNLSPLTTGTATAAAGDGNFCTAPFCSSGAGPCDPNDPEACTIGVCSGQMNPGAFGVGTAQRIVETGSSAGALGDRLPHEAVLASTFCIPPPGEPATSAANLPGPGAVSLRGTVQIE